MDFESSREFKVVPLRSTMYKTNADVSCNTNEFWNDKISNKQ